MSGGGEGFYAVDECVFMCAMKRVASLECQRAFPLLAADEFSGHPGREHELAIGRIPGLGQSAERAADQLAAVVVVDDAATGMIHALSAINTLEILGLVPVKDFQVFYDCDDVARLRRHSAGAAGRERSGFGVGQRKRNRNGPGVSSAFGENDLLVEREIKGRLLHGAGQRR